MGSWPLGDRDLERLDAEAGSHGLEGDRDLVRREEEAGSRGLERDRDLADFDLVNLEAGTGRGGRGLADLLVVLDEASVPR